MIDYRIISGNLSIALNFPAAQILVSNLVNQWLYINFGSTSTPNASNAPITVAPWQSLAMAVPAVDQFGITVLTAGPTPVGGVASIFFFDTAQPIALQSSAALLARAAFYDRNPLTINLLFPGPGIGPHGTTQRFAYTVPANRIFMLGNVQAYIRRASAATTAGPASINFNYRGNTVVQCTITSNVVDRDQLVIHGGQVFLPSGSSIVAFSQDASTGGTIDYYAALVGTEFDQ